MVSSIDFIRVRYVDAAATLNNLGVLQFQTGSYKTSIETFQKALELLKVYSGSVTTMMDRFYQMQNIQDQALNEQILLSKGSSKLQDPIKYEVNEERFHSSSKWFTPISIEQLCDDELLENLLRHAKFLSAVCMYNLALSILRNSDSLSGTGTDQVTRLLKTSMAILDRLTIKRDCDGDDTNHIYNDFFQQVLCTSTFVQHAIASVEFQNQNALRIEESLYMIVHAQQSLRAKAA